MSTATTTVVDQLVKAVSHPLRSRALAMLVESPASPTEIAHRIHEHVSNVSYHVRILEELGVVELVETRQVRGAVEHIYRALAKPSLSDEEWVKLSEDERQAFSAEGVRLMFLDAIQALGAGTFDSRTNRHMSRSLPNVDEEGWAELTELLAQTFYSVEGIEARSAARMARSKEAGTSVMVGLLCFERAVGR